MTFASDSPDFPAPAAPTLTPGEAARLRAAAQTLDVGVRVGKAGLTPTLLVELERAFAKAELVKVKITGDRDHRAALANELAAASQSANAGGVGGVVALYRPRDADGD